MNEKFSNVGLCITFQNAHTEARRGRAKAGKGATYIEEVKRGKSFCCVNRRLLVGGAKGALVGGNVREVVLDHGGGKDVWFFGNKQALEWLFSSLHLNDPPQSPLSHFCFVFFSSLFGFLSLSPCWPFSARKSIFLGCCMLTEMVEVMRFR